MIRRGIYTITNTYNDKKYVGSAKYFNNRWEIHRRELKTNKHGNHFLQKIYNKYGLENLKFEIIEFVEDVSKLLEREQYYIDTLKPEYNILKIAGSRLGTKHSEETKIKLKEARKNRITKNETRIKMSIARKGRYFSPEHRAKISASKKGLKFSEAHKLNLRKSKMKKVSIDAII